MPPSALLREAEELKAVCQRIELLAEQHSHISEVLLIVSESIRGNAVVLEVLVATRFDNPPFRPV